VLSGRGLCDELISRPRESYRLWCVVVCDRESSTLRRPWPTGGCCVTVKKKCLTFWHRSFIFNSNKSPIWCKNFSVYYPDDCLQLNMSRAFFHPSSGAQWLQWQPLVFTFVSWW